MALAALAAGVASAGPEVNVSQAPGPQNEPSVAVDPADPRVLVAGSNSLAEGTMRVYSSTDGGATWTSATLTPAAARAGESCAADPAVAVARSGRQYYAFLRTVPCATRPKGRVFVATRAGPDDSWHVPDEPIAPLGRALAHDKPAIAVDASPTSPHEGRVYVAWSRVIRPNLIAIVLSYSDDGGRRWSRPVRVNDQGELASYASGDVATYASLAVAPRGAVYVAWDDISTGRILVDRAPDGVAFGRDQLVARYRRFLIPHCGGFGVTVPAQGVRCIRSNPIVTVDTSGGRYRGRVYVTYSAYEPRGTQDVFLTVFDRRLRALHGYPLAQAHARVTPADGRALSDQFWPASAVDPSTGRLWVCFYDTAGDRERRKAAFSCTGSADGGRTFARPRRVASVASDATRPRPSWYGDYQGLAAGGGAAHPMWTDLRDLASLDAEIYTTTLREGEEGRSPPPGSGAGGPRLRGK